MRERRRFQRAISKEQKNAITCTANSSSYDRYFFPDIAMVMPSLPLHADTMQTYYRYAGGTDFMPIGFNWIPGVTYPLPGPPNTLWCQAYVVAFNNDGQTSGPTSTQGPSPADPVPPVVFSVDSADGTAITVAFSKPAWGVYEPADQWFFFWSGAGGSSSASGTWGGDDTVYIPIIGLSSGDRYSLQGSTADPLLPVTPTQIRYYDVFPHAGAPPFPTCN